MTQPMLKRAFIFAPLLAAIGIIASFAINRQSPSNASVEGTVSFRVVMSEELRQKYAVTHGPGVLRMGLYAPGREIVSEQSIFVADGLKQAHEFTLPRKKLPFYNLGYYKLRAHFCPKASGSDCDFKNDENFIGMKWIRVNAESQDFQVALDSHHPPAAGRDCAPNDYLVAGNIEVSPMFRSDRDYVMVVTGDTLHFPVPENIRATALVMLPVHAGMNPFKVLKKDTIDPAYKGYLSFQLYLCDRDYKKDFKKCVDDLMGMRDERLLPLLAKKVSTDDLEGVYCGETHAAWTVRPDEVNRGMHIIPARIRQAFPNPGAQASLNLPLASQASQ